MPLNVPQRLFLDQARSDYRIFEKLARQDVCHRLHYLQMCTEKLSKAWFWKSMNPPTGGHQTFVPFLRALSAIRLSDFHAMFGYQDIRGFRRSWPSILNLALLIQNLAPGPTNPNPEYPWPRHLPTKSPLAHDFSEWKAWNTTAAGRRLKVFVRNMARDYEVYFP